LRKLLTFLAGMLLVVAVVMIAMPRVWVKNKTARLVQDGRVSDGFRLYFGSKGRILLVPNTGDTLYAHLPERGGHATAICRKADFRLLKIFAFGGDSNCEMVHSDRWSVEGVKWKFSVPAGPEFEVTWETDFRR
jgi:hypothetical protein